MVLRNIIPPDLDVVIIMTANRAEAEAAFGEIWQQAGITHDIMRAALCAGGALPVRGGMSYATDRAHRALP
ncbi:MAG: hypothetical protein HEQ38_04205 [Gemmatimonas sp.]|nr:hypothetical protein [Gemmatimonas sp.]